MSANEIAAAGLSKGEKVALCRRLSSVHCEMILHPRRLVLERIDPRLDHFYTDEGKRPRVFIYLCIAASVLFFPWIYAHTLMDFPCKQEHFNMLRMDLGFAADAPLRAGPQPGPDPAASMSQQQQQQEEKARPAGSAVSVDGRVELSDGASNASAQLLDPLVSFAAAMPNLSAAELTNGTELLARLSAQVTTQLESKMTRFAAARGRTQLEGAEQVRLQRVPEKHCRAHMFLHSAAALQVGGVCLFVAVGAFVGMGALTAALDKWPAAQEAAWKPWVLIWYHWVGARLPRVRYSNFSIVPGFHTPLWLLSCVMYFAVVAYPISSGVWTGQPALGLVTAYPLGELFLKALNVVIGANQVCVTVTEAEVLGWRPQGAANSGEQTILQRLWELKGRSDFTCRSAELLTLRGLMGCGALSRGNPLHQRAGWGDSGCQLGPVRVVYLSDTNELIDVTRGELRCLSYSAPPPAPPPPPPPPPRTPPPRRPPSVTSARRQ